ncbi:GNAT family N-acetyltransferase [Pseudonocardia sp.]|uniref:GNAT family N-acetyltransferase n=1 Tax=Pseudonocardia sp. TaxID=60912 RepID=UPI00262246D4|nr:GNAT family N-acetyltransferase [Pseudonocardia sp.]
MIARVLIRDATPDDWTAIRPFFREIMAEGRTYTWPPDAPEDQCRAMWMLDAPGATFVATDPDGPVLGSAKAYPNHRGPGSHIASASFLVDPSHGGRGVGRALGQHVLDWARDRGFRAMQFNAVVETNTRAVALWRSLGFTVIGTLPEGFAHPEHGYVGLHIMHRRLH